MSTAIVHEAPAYHEHPEPHAHVSYLKDGYSIWSWLFTVARNKLWNFLAAQKRQVRGSGDSAVNECLAQQPEPHDDEAAWDREFQQRLFEWAAEQVRAGFEATTWQAFWQTAVQGMSPKEVAEKLEISVGAVYIAKSRVLTRLKENVSEVANEGDGR